MTIASVEPECIVLSFPPQALDPPFLQQVTGLGKNYYYSQLCFCSDFSKFLSHSTCLVFILNTIYFIMVFINVFLLIANGKTAFIEKIRNISFFRAQNDVPQWNDLLYLYTIKMFNNFLILAEILQKEKKIETNWVLEMIQFRQPCQETYSSFFWDSPNQPRSYLQKKIQVTYLWLLVKCFWNPNHSGYF